MGLGSIFRICASTLIKISIWLFACVVLCTSRRFQRHIFYLHKAPIWWGQKLDKPESFGFLHNQVLSFRIPTSDGQSLYAWLVTPLAPYAQNERAFLDRESATGENIAIELLKDTSSRLVIYFHGNAGSVGQERRTDAYRMISSGISDKIHVLAFDYRGFALSSGAPSETGLIDDALAIIKWATTVGGVPTNRIVLLAQSLGTAVVSAAVVSAAVDALLQEDSSIQFACLILCAAFPNAPTAVMSYTILGDFPLLAPLKVIPAVRKWFVARFDDTWDTRHRMSRILNVSSSFRLILFAAEDDEVMDFKNSETLFYRAVQEALGICIARNEIVGICRNVNLGEGGAVQEWHRGQKVIKMGRVCYGGKYSFFDMIKCER